MREGEGCNVAAFSTEAGLMAVAAFGLVIMVNDRYIAQKPEGNLVDWRIRSQSSRHFRALTWIQDALVFWLPFWGVWLLAGLTGRVLVCSDLTDMLGNSVVVGFVVALLLAIITMLPLGHCLRRLVDEAATKELIPPGTKHWREDRVVGSWAVVTLAVPLAFAVRSPVDFLLRCFATVLVCGSMTLLAISPTNTRILRVVSGLSDAFLWGLTGLGIARGLLAALHIAILLP